jgi:predicted nucleotide-binding protein (sugar kinase/HSP70/actin superfamily)
MDQPTYTPTQKIVEATGTLFFKFGDLDATKPAGSIKIRIETIVHYVEKYSLDIIRRKLSWLPEPCPLTQPDAATQGLEQASRAVAMPA